MNEELKEILKEIESYENEEYCLVILSQKQNKALLDYITNLQHKEDLYNQLLKDYDELLQENEELKKNQRYHKKGAFSLEYDKETLRDMVDELQERIEKAVKYIENTPLYETTYDYNMEEELEIQIVSDETASNKLLNILNGRSDE